MLQVIVKPVVRGATFSVESRPGSCSERKMNQRKQS
jgi:hypothetical protein